MALKGDERIKRLFVVLAVMMCILCFSGCNESVKAMPYAVTVKFKSIGAGDTVCSDHIKGEELVRVEISFPGMDDMELFGYDRGRVLPNYDGVPVNADVYVLKDCSGDDDRSYLVVESNFGLIIENITPESVSSMGDVLYVCDIDGDVQEEIIVHRLVGSAGGAGSYKASIYKIIGNDVVELYSYDNENMLYTGFYSRLRDGYVVEIINRYTGKKKKLSFAGEDKYEGVIFDSRGKPIDEWGIICDSFCEFVPDDIDGDGVYEIVCKQYVSLYSHSDGLGLAESVLKYNVKTRDFEIVDSDFYTWNDVD